LRVPPRRTLSLQKLVAFGTISVDARHCYAGWSKPMLAALHALVLRSERVLIVQDSRELALDPPHAIRLEGRPPNW
jgi:pilus assembly protein CpaF